MSKASNLEFARALADETRQKIMQFCCCEWRSVGEITEEMEVAQPTVSHHLAVLRAAGLVQVREEGRQTFYTLDQDRVAFCCGQIMHRFAPEEEATRELVRLLGK
jgi:DNA-binding transcriptional ArsR family regulator